MMVSGAPPPGGSADVAALVLDSFAYTARFIDDMYSLANPILEHLTYTNQQWFGLHGLYPPSLILAVAHHGAEVIYMDMRISMSVKNVPYAYSSRAIADFETYLFAKHVHGPFKDLDLCRYPHSTSMISSQAKNNILTTEFHRITRSGLPIMQMFTAIWRAL